MLFRSTSPIAFKTPIYLAQGASNITIKNCIIEGNNLDQRYTAVPMTRYDPSQNLFVFEKDLRNDGRTYTAGIILRSKAPTDKDAENSNLNRLDTLVNQNNLIEGNDISSFGYGIVSLGVGPLYNQYEARYNRYYNKNNKYNGNIIHDVTRAGIYIGFEETSQINNNKIYNITGSFNNEASGIIAGGDGSRDYLGYNNIALTFNSNEISYVASATNANGIKIEQCQNAYPFNDPPFVYFPNEIENMKLTNNSIWGVTTTATGGSRTGIKLYTTRDMNAAANVRDLTPIAPKYFTRNDNIINNTILLQSDNYSKNSACVQLQQIDGAIFRNNALAIFPNNSNQNSISTAVFLESQMPETGCINSDRNAFWYPSNSNASVFYFVETDDKNNILEIPKIDDFKYVEQWQSWTSQDKNSVFGNFTNDYTFIGTEPNQKLRIKSNPVPIGSVLNNRADAISWVTKDIDGKTRGSAGQRYDIGAVEFDGRVYVADIEVTSINEPQTYKASSGEFSDAEYIMTEVPFVMKARLRNNGNILMARYGVTLKLYKEEPDGTFPESPDFVQRVETEIEPSESVDVLFDLRTIIGSIFVPKTYYDLRNDSVPYIDRKSVV